MKWLRVLALVGIVAGCAAPAPTPTSPPAATPTSSAAVVPNPRPTPTQVTTQPAAVATQAPSVPAGLSADQAANFSQARLLQVEGNYADAAATWRSLLNSSASAEARFSLALCQAQAGDGAAAQQTLASGVPDPRDDFVRGLALEAQGQHAQAMQSLADYANANPSVAPAVWLEIAERELNARRAPQAADATATALDSAQGRPLKQRLLDVRAQALAELGDSDAAFDAHRQVLALATSTTALGEQLFHLAQVSRDLGKPDAALQALKTALDQFPNASTTPDALRLLDELQAADQVDPFVLGRARYFAVDYRNAVSAFDRYLQSEPDGPDAPSARLYRALASLTPGNEPNALRELDSLADDSNQDSDIAAQALLEAGQALEGLSEPDAAETHYLKLLQKFPRLDAAATAGFRLGLVRYVRGDDAGAIDAWAMLIARRDDLTSDDVARAFYWRGKALQRQGRSDEARDSLTQAAAITPASYYSLRAAASLGQLAAGTFASQDADETHAAGTSAGRDAAETQLAKWLSGRGQDLNAARNLIATDPTLARAQAEAAIGLYREGNWEADELLTRYPDRTDRLYALSRRFAELGLAGGATQFGQAAYTAASIQSPQSAPAALLMAAYPRPFANLSDDAADRYGIDPLLLDASLRDASQFDAWSEDATSGARGLAHTSPVHADEAALALHTNPDDQLRPQAAVEQQAWLLADRLRRYGGRPELAFSAIASTERLADGWAARSGADDPDTYIETIDFEGVRAGLRSLLATRLGYAAAYGSSGVDPTRVENVKPEPTAAWIKISRLSGDVPSEAPASPAPAVGSADQQAAFARAAALQRDGDYDGATGVFADLARAAEPEVARAARLRLGQALIAARRPAEAHDPLQALDAAQPGGAATFLLGRALADLGRCQDALARFSAFESANPGPLGIQAVVARASCLADLGRPSDAVPLLEQAVSEADVSRLQTLDFRERLAVMRLRAGDADGARADYQALLSIARSSGYRAQLNYNLGVLALDPAAAASYFRTALQLDPKSRGAQAALDELVALHDPAALSFEAGDARFAQNRYREALAAYTSVVQQTPTDPRAPQAYYGRGVSLVRLGQDRAGIAVLESIADMFPNTSDAANGLFRGARIRETLSDLDGAASVYRRLISMPGAESRVQDAEFRLAFVQFQQGALGAASEGWRALALSASAAEIRAQANFWLGKVLHAQGDEAGARTAWSAASQADPRGFYGLRAADWLTGGADPLARPDQTAPLVAAHADDDPAVALSAWAAGSGGDVAAARGQLSADPGLARAETLLAVGLRQPAIWELGAVEARMSDSVAAVAMLGAWEQQHGLYNTALMLGYDVASMSRVSLVSGPAAVRRLVYPLPNPAVLRQASQQMKVDPLLFSALMLQESLLDQNVESAAQARGLSQLIASTAYDAARALGIYGFHTTDLYQPKTSILLGAFTFGERLSRYGDEIFPSLAAYNAAEFAVDGWLQSAGSADIDTFAEAIPFTETYPYVQKIYENYRQYLELYAAP
jgi:soluble lytic murein transglycosylase